ncbi:MAG: TetR/AcrR family transcriptional regulator [Thermoflexibacter sp.]|uniref:DNA-binding transcriptional regulator, AcrR family n=1 Tax=Thermoflexibacter ruber TaxID=1003 RepID=A0A1I2IVM4_9BACT|nr:TetR/AcrR family transcriptional regulator [Thermoflexibacter ruber]SFF44776.1 DNA-binding transcriptional regulator, AcrR family [Thermoflexibacter ruber]
MGVLERKEREKIQRRNVIIDAAERVFFKEGIENASMDQVALEAELSKGTLYLYFKSKEELYKAIIIRGFIALKRKLKEAVVPAETGLQNVKAISNAYIEFSKQHLGYFNAILHFQNDLFDKRNMDSQHTIESLEGGNAVISVLINAIKKGIEDKSINPNINPIEVAFVLWSQITGLLQVIQRKMRIITYYYKIKDADLLDNYFYLLEKSLKA